MRHWAQSKQDWYAELELSVERAKREGTVFASATEQRVWVNGMANDELQRFVGKAATGTNGHAL